MRLKGVSGKLVADRVTKELRFIPDVSYEHSETGLFFTGAVTGLYEHPGGWRADEVVMEEIKGDV